LYKSIHTGEDNRSYHRGDSWFWVNNIAAICMHRLDKERFKNHYQSIINASTNDILWKGAAGASSEISSASSQDSNGCLVQAWSLATYIELIQEIYKR
jgi:glycogen debranching enzyme